MGERFQTDKDVFAYLDAHRAYCPPHSEYTLPLLQYEGSNLNVKYTVRIGNSKEVILLGYTTNSLYERLFSHAQRVRMVKSDTRTLAGVVTDIALDLGLFGPHRVDMFEGLTAYSGQA